MGKRQFMSSGLNHFLKLFCAQYNKRYSGS